MLLTHRSERADPLVAALAGVLSGPAGGASVPDPFAPEIVAVPSRGVERWLAQQLSHTLGAVDGDGVCANVLFPSSARLLDDAAAAADPTYAGSVEAWAAERAVWPLLGVIDECVPTEPWAAVLAAHLGADGAQPGGTRPDGGRRFAVASKLARYFEAYGRARPAMLAAWQAGRDEQGDGTPLPPDLVWQAQLWRRLRAELGPSPAEALPAACARLRDDPGAAGLPERLSIFGVTRFSPARVAVLAALAEHREVHLWLHHPSPVLWAALRHAGAGRRRTDSGGTSVRHPLLASLSRDIRELQQLLPAGVDAHHPVPARPDTVLGRLQDALASDSVPAEPVVADERDRSLRVHACHGPARQVEVVREAVLGLLAADPALEPRDILIMCPDVEAFAPLVAAAFGMLDEPGGHPAAGLRVRLADRSLRQTNPLLRLLSQLLELAAGRVTATALLDLAGAPPVRARFAFTDDDLEQLRDWTVAANARWGIDAAHRAPYGLGDIAQGTWRAAVDRLLLGVAMEQDDRWIADVLPVDDVDSGAIDLVGRLAELVDRVEHAVRALAAPHTVPQWAALLDELVGSLGEPEFAWQAAQLRGELADLAEAAGESGVTLTRADVAALLHTRLAGRPTRASFRTGTLTVCTLVPMRSVPHRVVCLVGMDDGAFPRHGLVDGDDVLARDPRTGERDVRSEDRQLFLDAICAARENLVITYTGADPRTGADVPPCVPLGELLDAVDAAARTADGRPGRERVLVRHPLQPFDPRNFTAGTLGPGGPFSFDPAGLAGARAVSSTRRPAPPLVARPLDPAGAADVELEDLVRFLQHPVRGFLRQRLGISTYDEDGDPADALPVELDGLQSWAVGDRMLRNRLAGMSPETCTQVEWRSGELPPGPLGTAVLRDIGARIDALLAACQLERAVPPRTVDVSVRLDDGRRVVGTVGGVRASTVLTVGYSSLAGKHRLAAWARHLALVAALGDGELQSVTVGRRGRHARRSVLHGVDPDAALRVLAELVALRDAGLCAPLPMALDTSQEYAERRHRGQSRADALEAARLKWEQDRFAPENAEPAHRLVFGGTVALASGPASTPASADDGWPDETTAFAVLARRLWTPLLAHEIDVRP